VRRGGGISVGERSVMWYVYETRKKRVRSGILAVKEGRRYRKKQPIHIVQYSAIKKK